MNRPAANAVVTATLLRYGVSLTATAALLAGCGGSQSPLSPSPQELPSQQSHAEATYKLLYAFPNYRAGYLPRGSLIGLRGSLYGTTSEGGPECGQPGCGTVFSLSLKPSVRETVLHSFGNGSDGGTPYSGVTALADTIYGTTFRGGLSNGVVYSVHLKSGQQTVLHQFQRTRDGRGPVGGLASIGNTLYGTTSAGYNGHGAVFSIDSNGHEAVIYRFKGRPDGSIPRGDLLAIGNVLYGTTASGGSNPGKTWGTVFSVTLGPSGPQEKVLYSFRGGANGKEPQSGLIYVNGLLYGVTPSGGLDNNGTVFSLNPSTGQEIVLYKFRGGTDAWIPIGNLSHFKGILYGASYFGGLSGYGTVFALNLDGSGETIVHSFSAGRTDGANPEAGVALSNGTLYGTTAFGGKGDCTTAGEVNGCGTIYSITP
jgi:uncharacterized repeat protein (TIGR03803 family)